MLQECYDKIKAMCEEFRRSTRNVRLSDYGGGYSSYRLSSRSNDDDVIFDISANWALAVYFTFKLDHPEYYWLSSEVAGQSL